MRGFLLVLASLALSTSAHPQLKGDIRESYVDSSPTPRDPLMIPPHFACKKDSDCVERNVGNCCGAYPMCANKQATLPKPCPNGGFGVCGFPAIDKCKCGSLGGCVSLQGGRPVHGSEYDKKP